MISKELKNSMTIHHIALTVVDAQKTKEFYTKIFGKPDYANSGTSIFNVGQTALIFIQKDKKNPLSEKFDPTVIGLEHFALGLKNGEELKQVAAVLTAGNIENSGIHIDKDSGREKIWLNDPSGIRIEFFL
jgi:glyoxylase I family protein